MTTGATPSKEQLIELVKTDLAQFNQLRRDNPRLAVDLSGAELQGAALKEVNLSGANLTSVNLKQADLTNANFHRSNLDGASLEGAKLGGFTGEPCMRICLHESSFKNVHLDKGQLEQILALINLNGSFEIKYELVPKK